MAVRGLTESQRSWLAANYAGSKNQDLAAALGISYSSVGRWARLMGLCKSREFMAAMQRNAVEKSARANRLAGGNAGVVNLLKGRRFKPGESPKDRMSAEAFAEMHRRIGATRREIFRRERLRVKWGLPQQTQLRVVKASRVKVNLRYGLRKHGYEIERGGNEALITASTRRSDIMEERGERMGIRFYYKD